MLRWISLHSFRSYSELIWTPEPGTNVLVGDNGSGKTNLLEAVAYLATLRSFRSAPDEALIKAGADLAAVRGETGDEDRTHLIELEIPRRGRRRVRLDQKSLQRSSHLREVVKVVTFLPEDLELAKGGPQARRDLIDDLATQLWPGAELDQGEFDRALRQRNAFLRSGSRDEATLQVWDSRLAQAAGRVMLRRARAAAAIAGILSENYSLVAGREESIDLGYESEWGGSLDPKTPPAEWEQALREALRGRRRADWETATTGAGPHRDDVIISIGPRPARHQASQGEQRTLALALRLASHTAISEATKVIPLLLLDDVFSELDHRRAGLLTKALPAAQTLITTTRPEEVPVDGTVWRVEGGAIHGS
ncbi:MAG TPA: DNA replication/repair protein RecF [Acidimicrobiia bacterium]|nr:DNA replication/repair protein RecF [Acidimicrobiia bacterium]